jgi:CHAT domain-containing protein
LPGAEKEATVVAEVYPHGQLLTGAQATEHHIAELIRSYNLLHFATHGVVVGSELPEASSLLVSADDHSDGFFSAAEIAALDLSGVQVAVLSACETSVGEDEGALGSITGAFISAGVPTVIGSLWRVDDEATTQLMLGTYERLLDVGAGDALRAAAAELRRDPRFGHPYYWAAFVVYGWDK